MLGATNRPQDLDEAVLRRFQRRIFCDLPSAKDRSAILEARLSARPSLGCTGTFASQWQASAWLLTPPLYLLLQTHLELLAGEEGQVLMELLASQSLVMLGRQASSHTLQVLKEGCWCAGPSGE